MAAAPLSHHEVLQLVEPFSRAGLQLDPAATRRQDRCLVFKAVEHPAAAPDGSTLHETLELAQPAPGRCRLTRQLVWHPTAGTPGELQATLQVWGAQADALLRQVQAIPRSLHFAMGPGWVTLRDYTLPAGAADPASLQLQRAFAFVEGLRLGLTLPEARRAAADLSLVPPQGDVPELPEDLLAVLGWNWSRLLSERGGWSAKLRLRGTPAARSVAAVAALERAAAHLAATMAASPGEFHDRHARARRRVTLRRAIPALTGLTLLAGVALAPRIGTPGSPGAWILLFHLPTALFALSFTLQELPRLEIPPWPRRSTARSWRNAQGGDRPAAPPQVEAAS